MTLSGRLDRRDSRLDAHDTPHDGRDSRFDRRDLPLDRPAFARAALLTLAIAALVLVRAVAARSGNLDGLAVGLAFGIGLVAIGVPGRRIRLPRATELGLGVACGLALIGIAFVGPGAAASILLRPAADFAPWAAVTVLVASAEELVLRGALFDAFESAAGPIAAIAATSALFALMHVPLYGWHVVPLDLGVGVVFAGLRLMSGGVIAPALAHSLADLATWWL
jgi:membrane protease YdiL (CAAX protease family)